MNCHEFKQQARRFGADLAGVAPMERFAALPNESNPLQIFPEARSLIVIGRRIPAGTLRAVGNAPGYNATYYDFGFTALEDQFLAKLTYDVCIWMEAHGYEAVPMFGYDTDCTGKVELAIPVAPDKPAPNVYVDWRYAAQQCGLGEIGAHGLFLTPEFGVCQRFAMLLSDFEFDTYDAVFAPHLCTDCAACAAACPLGALTADTAVRPFPRRTERCSACRNGAEPTNWGRFNTVDRIAAICGRACQAALSRKGLIVSRYVEDTPWRKDIAGNLVQETLK